MPRARRLVPARGTIISCPRRRRKFFPTSSARPLTLGYLLQEALEVLRTTSSTVELVVCRLPGDAVGSPPAAEPPPPPTRKDNPGLSLKIPLNPLPPLNIEPCGVSDRGEDFWALESRGSPTECTRLLVVARQWS